MCERALERRAFGKTISANSNVQDWIAQSRIDIDMARLLVLRAAAKIDEHGNKAAQTDVAAIKVVAAQLQTKVLDRAIQTFGAMGLTEDTPLAFFYTWGRALHIGGPDEVHLRAVARSELGKAKRARQGERGISRCRKTLARARSWPLALPAGAAFSRSDDQNSSSRRAGRMTMPY